MEKIVTYITKNLISVIGIVILTGTTLTTSALGVMKVASNFEKIELEVPEVKEVELLSTPSISPTPKNASQQVSGLVPRPKITSTVKTTGGNTLPLSTTTSNLNRSTNQSNPSSVGCSITLFGKQYDVTGLRTTHSGGDIFTCGTDMSSLYQGRHGTNLSRMQQYLITSGGTTSSNTNNTSGESPGGTSIRTEEKKDEIENRDEDYEEEKREVERSREDEEDHFETFLQKILQIIVS